MNSEQLKRLMRLSRRTGTPLIISEEDDAMVILDVDQFEALLGVSEMPEWEEEEAIFEESFQTESGEPKRPEPALEVMPAHEEVSDIEEMPVDLASAMREDAHRHPTAPMGFEEEASLPNVRSAADEDPFAGSEEQFYLEPID